MLELELENMGEVLQQLAPRRTGSLQIPMYRHYASEDILAQLQSDNFFVEEDQKAKVGERLGRKTTLYITLTKQDAASEERILGIIDEVQEQVNLIGRYIQNTTEEAKREAQNLAASVTIRDIVFVVSETSTKQQIKSILEKYKNPTTNNQRTRENLQTRFRRVVGVVSTEEFSEQTKRRYALLSRKLLGITEKDLRDALMTNDDMIAIMIGDALVTSQTTKDSEKGKQIIKLARKINKPSVVFDEIRYQVPSSGTNRQTKVWESRWGFSYYSLPFLRPQTKRTISERIKSKSDNAEEARKLQRDLSIKTLMILDDYKQEVSNADLYLDYISKQQIGIEQETWKALAATVYGARKEGGDILTMLMGLGIYDSSRHDVMRISQEQLRAYSRDPALVIGTLPNTRMPGNRPTLRPVARR